MGINPFLPLFSSSSSSSSSSVPMYGNNPNLRPPYGGVLGLPPQYTMNPDFFNQNPHLLTHPFSSSSSSSVPLNLYIHRQNPYMRNPNFPIQQHPNTNPTSSNPTSSNPDSILGRIECAVKNSHDNLLAIGDNITAWGVSQAALVLLQVDSWASLGFQIHQIPSLSLLMSNEAKVNSYIDCFVLSRRFTSVYDLEIAICKSQGVEKFEGLKLGPILKHPSVLQYFSVPSDVKQVHKITSETVVTNFVEFVRSCDDGKSVKKRKFLQFLATKEAVARTAMLGVRIPQYIKPYVDCIRDASKEEGEILKSSAQAVKQKSVDHNKKEEDEVSNQPAISSEKKLPDKFSTIPQHVKSFSPISIHSDSSDNNNIITGSDLILSSHGKMSSKDGKYSDQHVDSYPLPSTSEEENGGFGVEVNECSPSIDPLSCDPNKKSSDKKARFRSPFLDDSLSRSSKRYKSDPRIIKNPDFPIAMHNSCSSADRGVGDDFGKFLEENAGERSPDTQIEMTDFSAADNCNLVLTDDTVNKFISTWKDACQVHSVDEVFERMINFYNAPSQGRKKISVYALHCLRRQIKSLTSTYPCIGLLNVAIRSIKCGMWDNVYDTSQTMGQHGCRTPTFSSFTDWKRREAELLSKTDSLSANECSSQPEYSLTVDGILKKVGTYFEMNHCTKEADSPLDKLLDCSRRLRDCEVWLTKQFSVKDFDTLGHGEFFKFLEANSSQLPYELYGSFTGDLRKKSVLEVTMLGQQLILLLSQAASSLWVNGVIRKHHISFLLRKQFPTISLEIGGDDLLEDLAEYLKKQGSGNFSSCVLFSATLLRSCYLEAPSACHLLEGTTGLKSDLGLKCGVLGSVSSEDALKCLLRAPMLTDLLSWSHWDLIFGPSLGPLADWLLNEVHTKELMCLVTKDGKIIRVDHSVTIDDFLASALQGSSFETAVKLLSLVSLYGGDKQVPMSLLRSHGRQAIEVILKNSLNSAEVANDRDLQIHEEALRANQVCCGQTEHIPLPLNPVGTISQIRESQDLSGGTFGVNKAISVVSRFILDILGCLPSEFCSFAADIFLSGFKSLTGTGPSAILHECTQINQRMMLHDIGLTLGIVEWIGDYHTFCSSGANDMLVSLENTNNSVSFPGSSTDAVDELKALKSRDFSEAGIHHRDVCVQRDLSEVSNKDMYDGFVRASSKYDENEDATSVIESIRREEFGLIPSLSHAEMSMLKKQHARLGRALHCLSRELYSRDSHFLLELVQNADDNVYPESVEPALVFILQASGTAVLNNEQGFSAQNIRALCDVGNSTKGGSIAGYIGQKGIGFKSVFRVTDAPEIHSNGFHVKFDTSEGHIGFVLPTVVSPCDIDFYEKLIPSEVVDGTDDNNIRRSSGSSQWKTCIILPFKRKLKEGTDISSILSVFSDLHPSLLLFLHRLRCIKLVNLFTNEYFVMRRESLGGGIIRVSQGKEKTSWFVASQKLDASVIRPDVQTTEISIAFTLDESANGQYKPHLEQQPVFAFLPLRTYGLKFILQGDFVLPSSREEIDGDSAWNQWLLSEVPNLFVSAQRSFCAIPCFRESPGIALMSYLSYVPLVGEVHGSLSHLPLIIMSKLRASNCMLLEGHDEKEWVPPSKALRCWDEQARNLLPDRLLKQHLGLGYLDKDVVLSDSLANALGIQEYGPKILVDVMSSVCQQADYGGIKSMGLEWFSSCLSSLYSMLVISSTARVEVSDIFKRLARIPFIPLSDGTYSSVAEGSIWLPSDDIGFEGLNGPDFCPSLYAKLRTVNPAFLSSPSEDKSSDTQMQVENCIRMLNRIGVRRLSAHEIIVVHILPAITDDIPTKRDDVLMTEYVSFIMLHLQSTCPRCCVEREHIISELRTKAFILTNHGYKRPHEIYVHFSVAYENPVDVSKLLDAVDVESNWHEVDVRYLKHANVSMSPLFSLMRWREFFQELGITDFVKIIQVEKNEAGLPLTLVHNEIHSSPGLVLKDWESAELVSLLFTLSSQKNHGKCKYLLEVLDDMWDDCFASKVTGCCISKPNEDGIPFESSFIKSIHGVQWVVSSTDQELHYPKDLFIDCEAVRSILGDGAPYAVPQVKSRKLIRDVGFKTQVALDDALRILHTWRRCKTPFKASITQMSKFYSFIWDAMINSSKGKILEEFSSRPSIFVPYEAVSGHESMVKGMFLSRDDVYWHDPTGSVDLAKALLLQHGFINGSNCHLINTLAQVYHGFHDFFVDECRVREIPPFKNYIQILLQLSNVALPSQAATAVFKVFLKWANDLKSGLLGSEDVLYLKEFLQKKKNTVLPTVQDKWVSLHRRFGLVCWCDDEQLKQQFTNSDKVCFLYFGELSNDEKKMLPENFSMFMQAIGVPSLSEVVTRVAVYEGVEDFTSKALLVDRVLPFAQRYIYKSHPDQYLQLKQSGGENLSQLQVVVVKKLSYRYNLEGCKTASNKCLKCRCLLQENVLYIKQKANSHSIFLELSRLFYHGIPELHLANFLHMVASMAESGCTEEQIEFFVVNSQNIPKLPENEPIWSLSSVSPPKEDLGISDSSGMVNGKKQSKSKRKRVDSTCSPAPANKPIASPSTIVPPNESYCQTEGKPEVMTSYTDKHGIPIGVGFDWIILDDTVADMEASLQEPKVMEDLQLGGIKTESAGCSSSEAALNEKDPPPFITPNEHQAAVTGRLGEFVAFKYLVEKLGEEVVNWVNRETETGSPYDIVLGKDVNSIEYIEVKATRSPTKDWFNISPREWQFATEKGDRFSILHVALLDLNNTKVTVFKNPARLCQQGMLKLTVLMSTGYRKPNLAS